MQEGMTMAKITATWDINLWAECPGCGKGVDLLDADDFWVGRSALEPGMRGTINVACPECGHEFAVDLEY